jgi:regulatory protein
MPPKRPRPPLNAEELRALALRYVGRFATSRAKLAAYLARKIRERGWEDDAPADIDGLVERFAELGYVDDGGFAAMKGAALTRRGYGARRVDEALRADGIGEADRAVAQDSAKAEAWASADRLARRKRAGPYGSGDRDPKTRERMIAAFLRAGHDYAMARRWVDAAPGEPPAQEEG